MHHLLEFYKDLIVFTAGTAILILWVLMFIEIYDRVRETFDREENDEDA